MKKTYRPHKPSTASQNQPDSWKFLVASIHSQILEVLKTKQNYLVLGISSSVRQNRKITRTATLYKFHWYKDQPKGSICCSIHSREWDTEPTTPQNLSTTQGTRIFKLCLYIPPTSSKLTLRCKRFRIQTIWSSVVKLHLPD